MGGDMKPGLTAIRNLIRLVDVASAVTVVQVSESGSVSSKRPLENLVGTNNE